MRHDFSLFLTLPGQIFLLGVVVNTLRDADILRVLFYCYPPNLKIGVLRLPIRF